MGQDVSPGTSLRSGMTGGPQATASSQSYTETASHPARSPAAPTAQRENLFPSIVSSMLGNLPRAFPCDAQTDCATTLFAQSDMPHCSNSWLRATPWQMLQGWRSELALARHGPRSARTICLPACFAKSTLRNCSVIVLQQHPCIRLMYDLASAEAGRRQAHPGLGASRLWVHR